MPHSHFCRSESRRRRGGGGGCGAAVRLLLALALAWSAPGGAAGCWPLFEEPPDGVAARARERTVRAPIIVVGYVERALRKPPPPPRLESSDDGDDDDDEAAEERASIYSIECRIVRVIKGNDEVLRARDTVDSGKRLHRITNFGGFKWCFSEVDEGKTYVLYLKLAPHGHLSAFYANYADAAEPWSKDIEDALIEQTQGYRPWTEWSACSTSCDGGVMRRTRACSRSEAEPCTEGNVEKKHCNTFPCSRTKNLLNVGGLGDLSRGVVRFWEDSRLYYDITPNFYAQFPLARLFDVRWPVNYSVIARVRPRRTRYPREGQYLFSVTDAGGRQSVGLRLYPSPTLEIGTARGRQEQLSLAAAAGAGQHDWSSPSSSSSAAAAAAAGGSVSDGSWLQFAFGVRGSTVESYYRCYRRGLEALGSGPPVVANARTSNVVLGTRMFRMDRGSADRYEGTIDQLLVTTDPDDAARQCSTRSWLETAPQPKPKSGIRSQNDVPCGITTEDGVGCGNRVQADYGNNVQPGNQASGHWAWSDWSPCSSSCGPGRMTRVPKCLLHILPAASNEALTAGRTVSLDDCIPYYVPPVHIKECYETDCPYCHCENGGTCVDDACVCGAGWRGEQCEEPVCSGGCGQHGTCARPGTCECVHGWSGERCEIPTCYRACRNGGTCVAPDSCRCPTGYAGAACSVRVIHCSIPCQNGGTCNGINSCDCPPDYSGRHCENDAQAPTCWPACLNGGTCGRGNACHCPSGYTGSHCERDVCGGCRNGGVCNGTSNSCVCTATGPPHTGQLCELEVQPHKCQGEQACLNGGLCVDYDFCSCPPGHWGRRCEFRVCGRHKVIGERRTELVRKKKYRYFTCPHSAVAVCREPVGYEVELRSVPSFRVDMTQCDD